MKIKFWSCLFLATSICSTAQAYDIFEALGTTYSTNPSLRAQRAYLSSVDENVAIAKSGYRPNVYLVGSYADSSYDANSVAKASQPLDKTQTTMAAKVSQPLFNGFQTVNSVKAADSYSQAEQKNLANVEQNILLLAATSYLDVLRDAMIVELQLNNEKLLKKRLDETRERFNVGELTITDVSQSEARYSQAKSARILAEGNLEASKSVYVQVVGIEPEELEEPENIVRLLPKNINEAISYSKDHNYQIQQARHVFESRDHSVDAATGALAPQVSLDGTAAKNSADYKGVPKNAEVETLEWSINMTVPLYSAGQDSAKIRQAKYQKWQAQELVLVTERDVMSSVTSNWEYLIANKSRIISIADQVRANEIALDGVQKEESVGNRTVLDVLNSYQELLNSNVEEVKAKRDYYLSAMQVLLSMGKLTAKELALDVELYNAKEKYKNTRDKWISLSTD